MSEGKQCFKVLACEVAQRELWHLAARSRHLLDMEFLPVGFHEEPKQGHLALQNKVDALEEGKYDAVLIGYGLCNQILDGLTARHTPLVIPRAHDCLTFFLGSKERQVEVHGACPGTFYFTAGWLEFAQRKAWARAGAGGMRQTTDEIATQPTLITAQQSYAEMVAKYGEDNARYLMEVAQQWADAYERGVLIDFDFAAPLRLAERVAGLCARRGWRFEQLPGDLGLLERWLEGDWCESDFLIVNPGFSVYAEYDATIMRTRKNL